MHLRGNARWLGAMFFIIFSAIISTYAFHASAVESCRPGEELITDATRALAAINDVPSNVNCWRPNDPATGTAAGEAKLFIQQHSTSKVNISCFNPDFAQKIQQLMEAVPGGVPKITDGYRSPQEQANLPKGSTRAGPCQSYHQYGLAADFNETDERTLQWMRVNASRFGLGPVTNANPVSGCTPRGFCDSGHIQIAASLPPRNQCGMCSGGPVYGTLPSTGGINTPTSGLFNSLRQWLAPQPAAPAQPSLPSQPVSQSQSPLQAFDDTTNTNDVGGVSSQLGGTSENTSSSTAADRLEELAFGPKATTSTATSSVPLVVSGSQAVILSGSQSPVNMQNVTGQGASSPVQQTFISGDLSWQSDATVSLGPVSGWQAALITMKAVLQKILQYLVPFGGTQEIQINGNGNFEGLE